VHPYPEAALHAKIVLEATKGTTTKEIAHKLEIDKDSVKKWRDRYELEGIQGLYPKHGGGSMPSVDNLKQEIQRLLNEETIWTVPKLVEQTGGSESAVKAVLRNLGVTLQRNRTWEHETALELVEKYIDIVGIYISSTTRIVVLCSNNEQELLPSKGMITTRNKAFFHELEKSLPVTIVNAIVAASKYADSGHYSTFNDAESFLDDLVSGLPISKYTEFHLIMQSTRQLRYRGKYLTCLFPVYVETEEQWLSEIKRVFSRLKTRNNPEFADDFTTAVRQFSQACKDGSEPFIWKKQLDWANEQSKFAGTEPDLVHPDLPTFNGIKSFEDHLISLFPSEIEDDELQCAMIAVVRSKDGIMYKVAISKDSLPAPETFQVKTKESFISALSHLEMPLIALKNEIGKQALSLYMESVKKTNLGNDNRERDRV
jgi:transposase